MTRSIARIGLLAIGALMLTVAGCTSEDPSPPDQIDLTDTEWVLDAYGDPGNLTAALPGHQPTISFGDDNVSGFTGCNVYGGDYASSMDGTIEFGMLIQTEMACPEPGVMEQEAAFMDALRLAQRYEYTDAQLHITGDGGLLVLSRE